MQKIKFMQLLELALCYFDLIFDQQVEVIFVDRFRNSKVLSEPPITSKMTPSKSKLGLASLHKQIRADLV